MPNPLTGDFEAVLQVSGSTINRLLASMHQNAFQKPGVPSFPHSVRMRIGDDHAFEGVRGLAHAQVSVPRVELIHGATDRFILEVGARAWYRPDPGSNPLPAYIHGTVRAEYRLQDIDPSCMGWSKKAAEFLWIRVVRDSVRFQGTGEDDINLLGVSAAPSSGDPAGDIARITRQVARLLAKRFEAAPHPVSKRFRRGSFRSLNTPTAGSAVALPLGLSGDPWGDISSIHTVLLNGSDLAVAVDINYLMGQINSALDPVRTFSQSISVEAAGISTVYRVGVDPPSVQWLPQGSYGLFKVHVNGWANTDSILPNAGFSIDQDVTLNFSGGLWLAPGSLTVSAHASGVGSGTVVNRVKNALLAAVPPIVQSLCKGAQPSLDKMTQTGELSNQLKTLDDQASVRFDSAEFVISGVVLRGTIDLSPRRVVRVMQEKTVAEDGFSALESWIPGGRIDRFQWSWTWFGAGDPGTAMYRDRFLLRRPAGKAGRWGMAVGLKNPLPGLDGWGTLCLKIDGVQVDPVTGQFVPVFSPSRCTRFGYRVAAPAGEGRLFLRDMPQLSQRVRFPQLKDLPLVGTGRSRSANGSANILLIHVDEAWTERTAEILRGGLEESRRYDAGLSVLVLFREGVLEDAGPGVIPEIEKFTRGIGIAAHVNEDVNGAWSRALGLRPGPGEAAWAVLSPEGQAVWKHSGPIEDQGLAAALDANLRRSPDFRPDPYRPVLEIGAAISAAALNPSIGDLIDLLEAPCPPIPLGRFGATVVTFVQGRSGATATHLRKLAAQNGNQGSGGPANILAVVDGADPGQAEALKHELGLEFGAVPDRDGRIADRFAIEIWPTTITLDRRGIVSDVQAGIAGEGI